MRQSVLLHLTDETQILGEVDQLPKPSDQFMIIHKPQQKDGSKLAFMEDNGPTLLIPWHQIAYVQLLPKSGIDEVIGFVRG